MKPVIMRMVVDLPAPFGPRKPSTSPRSTVNEMPSTARCGPKVFTRFSILIIDRLKWGQSNFHETNAARRCYRKIALTPFSRARDSRTSRRSKTMQVLRQFLPRFIASFAVLATAPAMAQKYPAKPIHILVPFAPGGGSDFIARFTAQRLTESLGSQVIVENRPGAGGLLGIEQGVRADPDGYTLTLIASSYTVNAALYPLKYDPLADITPLVQISQGPMIVVANPKFPPKTLPELIALAKQKPGSINFASAGQGSITHMVVEFFQYRAGVKLNHVPYKGTGPALTDTISGQTDIFFSSTATALPHVKSGRLRALAVTGAKRLPAEPGVPTIAESGVPGFDVILWHGLIAPKGVPAPIVERINAEVNKMLQSPETAKQLETDGVAPAGGNAQRFGEQIKKEIALWKDVVAKTGVKVQ